MQAKADSGGFTAWLQALRVYWDRRILAIFVMGFSSGLPLLLTLSTLSYWLAKVGVDKTTIGLFALVGLPYTLKFLWAPLFDHLRLPLLTRLLGRRRSWALVTQAGLIVSILLMGQSDPAVDPWWTALGALLVAFFSASQDIVIDAYRIDILEDHEQGAGSASTQAGYRVGLLVAGAGAIALSDVIGWPAIFAILAACVGIGMLAVLLAPEPQQLHRIAGAADGAGASDAVAPWFAAGLRRGCRLLAGSFGERELAPVLLHAAVAPFADFMRRRGWWLILLFVLLYKFGDAIGGVMANPFYVELGFTGTEIAAVSKVLGVLATLVGVATGGLLVARYGILVGLLVGGVLQAVTNLLFALQAVIGHDLGMLAVAIGSDNFTGGLGSAAFVAYLSSLCNKDFTATQYALLSAFMAFGRTVMSSGGGWLADQVDWASFFVLTTFLALPGLLLLLQLGRLDRQPRTATTTI